MRPRALLPLLLELDDPRELLLLELDDPCELLLLELEDPRELLLPDDDGRDVLDEDGRDGADGGVYVRDGWPRDGSNVRVGRDAPRDGWSLPRDGW